MPRKRTRTTERAKFSSEDPQSAIDDVKAGMSQREAGKKHSIPRATLQRYLLCAEGEGRQKSKLGRTAIFTNDEEAKLCEYVLDCSRIFHGLNLIKTRELAYSYAVNLHRDNIPKT